VDWQTLKILDKLRKPINFYGLALILIDGLFVPILVFRDCSSSEIIAILVIMAVCFIVVVNRYTELQKSSNELKKDIVALMRLQISRFNKTYTGLENTLELLRNKLADGSIKPDGSGLNEVMSNLDEIIKDLENDEGLL